MPARVRDIDRGYRALQRRVAAAAGGRAVTVGVHAEEGGAGTASGRSVLEVAGYHEFGEGHNPERSFIRAWAEESERDSTDVLRKLGQAVVKGGLTVEQGLEQAGLLFVGQVQARIRGGIAPANTLETIARKGSSTPLIDTGQLVSSITHRVE